MVKVTGLDNKTKGTQFSLAEGKKSIAVSQSDGVSLSMTNEYGNSIEYKLDKSGFDDLFSHLWEFVKDRQH